MSVEWFFEAVASFLGVLYAFTGSYGGAIILLTLVVMAVTSPLTLKSTRSMLQMQRFQPELKRIQAQYKDDRERLNTEMMAFYKEKGINPLSGCVPVLIQAPIFLVLYRVLRGITQRSVYSGGGIGRVAGLQSAGMPFTPWKPHDQVFLPQHLSTTSEMYQSLHASSKMTFLGVDLAISPIDALRIGVVTAIPFLLLMLGMLVSQVIQNRQIQGRNKNAPANPQQQMIMKVLPFMLPIFSFQFPAGLGLYYFVQGICRIGLQGYITKAVYEPHTAETTHETTATEKGSSSKAGAAATTSTKAVPASVDRSTRNPNPKSVAAQKKSAGAATTQTGRKSGSPRASGSARQKSGPSNSKRG